MIKFSQLNNISENLAKEIPALKAGQSVEYRLLNRQKDPENLGLWKIPSIKSIPNRQQIIDPHTDTVIEIAAITRIKTKSTPKGGIIEVPDIKLLSFTRAQAGTIILHGKNPQDRLIHEYMYLCPLNSLSPCRSDTIEPVYEYVDVKAIAKKGMESSANKMKAYTFINELTEAKGLFDYSYLVSRVSTTDVDVAKHQLVTFAEEDPSRFFELIESVDGKIKVTFLRAMSKGLIMYNAKDSTIRWAKSQEALCTISKVIERREEAFAVWAKASADNLKVVDTLSNMLAAKKSGRPAQTK